MLTPEEYDHHEKLGARYLPNRIIECCKPAAFNTESYPVHVNETKKLSRYVDVMHEGRLIGTFDSILEGGISEEEMALLKKVMYLVNKLSSEHYHKPVVPKDALLRALNIYRHINYLYPEKDITILEVGAGSGYVGALLMLSGYTYVSTEITQAFYIFQNHLMNAISQGKVIELVSEDIILSDIDKVEKGMALHIPWWKFTVPNPETKLGVDLVTANHCLCEMHQHALAYTLKLSVQLLKNKNADDGMFLFEGWGSTINNPIWTINKLFSDLNYVTVHNDTLATIYMSRQSRAAVAVPMYPIEPPTKTDKNIKLKIIDMINQILGTKNSSGKKEFTAENQWHPSIWVTPQNPVSDKIMQKRGELKDKLILKLVDYLAQAKELAKTRELQTDDELFLNYINKYL